MNEKIISFSQRAGGLNEAAFKNILWPCNCFTASIPYRGKDRLNIFEETILGLTAAGTGSTDVLAEASCLNRDLVLFIQNRLALLGFVDSRNEITDTGKKILNQKESDEGRDFVSAKFFMDVINSKLLPYVHIGQLENKTIIEADSNRIVFKLKETGFTKINASLIEGTYQNRQPKPLEMIRAIRAFQGRFRRYAAFSGNTGVVPPSISSKSSICINEKPEPVLLHCRAFIQDSNPDTLVVTDGFGFGYSDPFADYLNRINWDGIQDLQKQAHIDLQGNDENEVEGKPAKKKHTHRIAYLINESRKILVESQNTNEPGSAVEKALKEKLGDTLSKIYTALELAFTQIVFYHPVPEWEDIFFSQSFEENKELIVESARKIGLKVNKRNKSVLELHKGAINVLSPEKPDMRTSLCLAIVGAAFTGNHPFNVLSREYPDILSTIARFKKDRDEINHKKIERRGLEEKVQNYLDITEKIIILILPVIARQFESTAQINETDNTYILKMNQLNLQASYELDNYFGISRMYELDKDLKETLINISITAISGKFGNAQRGIINLASALQTVYHKAMLSANCLQIDINSSKDIKSTAFEKAFRHKFVPAIQNIHPVIRNVREEKLQDVIQDQSYSLQANFIAFLYICDDETLEHIHGKCPDLLDITTELAETREHGNTDFSAKALEDKDVFEIFLKLKEKTFFVIKTLLEVI
jgi:hypothetical protein